jgi:hypothetical protein
MVRGIASLNWLTEREPHRVPWLRSCYLVVYAQRMRRLRFQTTDGREVGTDSCKGCLKHSYLMMKIGGLDGVDALQARLILQPPTGTSRSIANLSKSTLSTLKTLPTPTQQSSSPMCRYCIYTNLHQASLHHAHTLTCAMLPFLVPVLTPRQPHQASHAANSH